MCCKLLLSRSVNFTRTLTILSIVWILYGKIEQIADVTEYIAIEKKLKPMLVAAGVGAINS